MLPSLRSVMARKEPAVRRGGGTLSTMIPLSRAVTGCLAQRPPQPAHLSASAAHATAGRPPAARPTGAAARSAAATRTMTAMTVPMP